MGRSVIIYGASGSGKSRSLKNFGKDEIFLVNVCGKDLPFRGKFRYTSKTDNVATIKKGLSAMPTKAAVIDDAGYIMTNTFMRGHSAPKQGDSTFDLFNRIADDIWSLMIHIQSLPNDVIVYIMMHEVESDSGRRIKLKTIGKLLDEKVCIEGMTTVTLHCVTDGTRHFFRTQSDGFDLAKAPEGMFADVEIDNDLKAVDTAIRDYYKEDGEE